MARRRAATLTAGVLAVISVLPACGDGDGTTNASSSPVPAGTVIEVSMTDNQFSPASFEVARGQAVTFRFTNKGAAVHEAVFGDEAFQMAHAESMSDVSMPHMSTDDHASGPAMGGDDEIVVQPGQSGEVTRVFDAAGTVLLGCHQPGHYEAGMKATVLVT